MQGRRMSLGRDFPGVLRLSLRPRSELRESVVKGFCMRRRFKAIFLTSILAGMLMVLGFSIETMAQEINGVSPMGFLSSLDKDSLLLSKLNYDIPTTPGFNSMSCIFQSYDGLLKQPPGSFVSVKWLGGMTQVFLSLDGTIFGLVSTSQEQTRQQ